MHPPEFAVRRSRNRGKNKESPQWGRVGSNTVRLCFSEWYKMHSTFGGYLDGWTLISYYYHICILLNVSEWDPICVMYFMSGVFSCSATLITLCLLSHTFPCFIGSVPSTFTCFSITDLAESSYAFTCLGIMCRGG